MSKQAFSVADAASEAGREIASPAEARALLHLS